MRTVSSTDRYVDAWDRKAEFHGIEIVDFLNFDQRNKNALKVVIHGGVIVVQQSDNRAIASLHGGGCIFDVLYGIKPHYRTSLARALHKIGMLTADQVDEEVRLRTAKMNDAKLDEAKNLVENAVQLVGFEEVNRLFDVISSQCCRSRL